MVAAGGEGAAAFSLRLVSIYPSPAQTFAQSVDVLGAERGERCDHFFGRFIEANTSLDVGDQRHIGVIGVELIKTEETASQFVVAEQRRNASTHRANQSVIDRDWHVVDEQSRLQGTGIIARPRAKHIRFCGIRKRSRERELVILKFMVELGEGVLSDTAISF